jgi:hypothetical protein
MKSFMARRFAALFLFVGCASPAAIRSGIRWNKDALIGCAHSEISTLALLEKSDEELARLMKCCSAPDIPTLCGKWNGVNKGLGPAAAGIHQDTKVFRWSQMGVVGHNVMVQQVPVESLGCAGWQPQKACVTGEDRIVGDFRVCEEACAGRNRIWLDYRVDSNGVMNPARYLLDELVEIRPGLLLGQAYIRVGMMSKPIAFFALEKACGACDEL